MSLDPAVVLAALLDQDGIGPATVAAAHRAYGSVADLCAATRAGRLDPALARRAAALRGALSPAALDAARRRLDAQRAAGDQVLHLEHPDYPPSLAAIHDPPPLLYLRGALPAPLAGPAGLARVAAVVGTRRASAWALDAAFELGRDLAAAGWTVVSGLALGVDGAAHRGALDAAADGTVAVLGAGLDRIHPPTHRGLAERIAAGGALLAEHPRGRDAWPGSFPRRNRVIAGLARAVVVVEAPRRSGVRHTVEFALQQGRDVYVVPQRPDSEVGRAAGELLRDGAAPLLDASDLLPGGEAPRSGAGPDGAGLVGDDARLARSMLAVLERDGRAGLERLAPAEVPVARALAVLTALERSGRVRADAAGGWRAVPTRGRGGERGA